MRTAIYPGSFDPITNGHLDIIHRALKVFDRIIIAVGINNEKKSVFPAEARVRMIQTATRGLNVEVDSFNCLLIDYARKKKCRIILRSFRALSDFDYEFQMALLNRKMYPSLEVVFLMPGQENLYLSSSAVKEFARKGGDIKGLVPGTVYKSILSGFR